MLVTSSESHRMRLTISISVSPRHLLCNWRKSWIHTKMTTQFLETFGSGVLIFTDNVSCQGQISSPAPKAMLEHADICMDGAVVAKRAAGGHQMGHGCREKGQWSHLGLRVVPAATCGPGLALPVRGAGGKRRMRICLSGTQSPEMGQVRGTSGASSSLKHVSRYHLSV